MKKMLVKIEVLKDGQVVESYTAPDGSWIQTDTLGAQRLPAVLKAEERPSKPHYALRYTPLNPPKIPEKLEKLLNSTDRRWGRNGLEWTGSHRDRSGGRVLDRVRELEYKIKWIEASGDAFPLKDDPDFRSFMETATQEVKK